MFQVCLLLLGSEGFEGSRGRTSHPTNDIPNKYIYDAFSMIYLSILLLLFHFLVLQRSYSEIQEGTNSVIL